MVGDVSDMDRHSPTKRNAKQMKEGPKQVLSEVALVVIASTSKHTSVCRALSATHQVCTYRLLLDRSLYTVSGNVRRTTVAVHNCHTYT